MSPDFETATELNIFAGRRIYVEKYAERIESQSMEYRKK